MIIVYGFILLLFVYLTLGPVVFKYKSRAITAAFILLVVVSSPLILIGLVSLLPIPAGGGWLLFGLLIWLGLLTYVAELVFIIVLALGVFIKKRTQGQSLLPSIKDRILFSIGGILLLLHIILSLPIFGPLLQGQITKLTPNDLSGTCQPVNPVVKQGEDVVWRVTPSGGNGSYYYQWSNEGSTRYESTDPTYTLETTSKDLGRTLPLEVTIDSNGRKSAVIDCGTITITE